MNFHNHNVSMVTPLQGGGGVSLSGGFTPSRHRGGGGCPLSFPVINYFIISLLYSLLTNNTIDPGFLKGGGGGAHLQGPSTLLYKQKGGFQEGVQLSAQC